MAKLTAKQQRFVEEYLIDLNATQAAIRAGYSIKRASEIGYQLLQKTTVSEAIAQAMAERSRRTGITQDRVIQELAKIAFAKMTDFAEWDGKGVRFRDSGKLSEEDAACVAEVTEQEIEFDWGIKRTKKIKLFDKVAALEKLGRHLGMFNDKLDIGGNVKLVFEDDYGDDAENNDNQAQN